MEPEVTRSGPVIRLRNPGGRWLHTGWNGGPHDGPVAHSVSLPEGWDPADIETDVRTRIAKASFDEEPGPVLLTGVAADHARLAIREHVTVLATAGLDNPAPLPVSGTGRVGMPRGSRGLEVGTVNVAIWTDRHLAAGGRANAVAIAAEAKAATLLATVGVPGTSTDAVLVGDRADGERVVYTGSGTAIGTAIRVAVRDAIMAALQARYDTVAPTVLDDADHPVEPVTAVDRSEVRQP